MKTLLFISTGSSIGSALTYPLCGYIIDSFGWEMAFYVCGIIGTIWYIAWYFMVFDSPQQHPRISQKEKDYIVESLGKNVSKKKVSKTFIRLFYTYKMRTFFAGSNSLETFVNFRSGVDEYFSTVGWIMGIFYINDTHSDLF